MKRRGLVLVFLLLATMHPRVALATTSDVRQKPGPATIRGVVRHAGTSSFTLTTATKGTFDVRVRPATSITVRGGHGKSRVNDGDHVGVRGFVHGRQVIAISIRIYPTKPKASSLTGTVVTVTGGHVVVASSGHQVSVQITPATTGDSSSAPGSGIRIRVGDRVRFRVVQTTQGLLALSVHFFHPHVVAHHVQLHGTMTVDSPSSITVRAGSHTYPVGLTSQTRVYLGGGQVSPRTLHSGDEVTVFACCDGQALQATSIHVRASRMSGAHLKVLGVVTALAGNRISVLSGTRRYVVTAGTTTRVYVGARAVTTRDLRVGQSVTVFACCGAQSPTASSIHVRVVKVPQRSSLVRGTIVSVTGNRLRLAVGASQVDVELQSSTTYDRGAGSATSSDLRPGVSVSVRGYTAGSRMRARRIHIFVASVHSQRIKGTVVSASRSTVIARAGGKVYTVSPAAHATVTLNHAPVALSALQPGDVVRVSGQPASGGRFAATGIDARRVPVKVRRVAAVLKEVHGNVFVITDGTGNRRTVKLSSGVYPLLHGSRAPAAALFPGARLVIRTRSTGGTLVATALTVAVRDRAVDGRVLSISRSTLVVVTPAQHQNRVDVPDGLAVSDEGRHLKVTALRAGAFVRAQGYEESPTTVRAASLQVLHPSLDVPATVVSSGPPLVVQTRAGDRYTVRIASDGDISTGRVQVALQKSDIAAGTTVRVQGTVRTDGSIAATQVAVRLPHTVVRGRVSAQSAGSLTVTSGTTEVVGRFQDSTIFRQGSHDITATDIVVGDDATVDGYRLSATVIAVRKVVVHRPVHAVDGTVASIDSDGFTLTTLAGSTRVITGVATVYSGAGSVALTPGARVHVSGYRRGDGVILATHVRVATKR